MVIPSGGYVGIGVSSPTADLDVLGTINVSSTISANAFRSTGGGTVTAPTFGFSADPNTGVYQSGADTLNFVTGGQQRFTITSVGYVLIQKTTSGIPPATDCDSDGERGRLALDTSVSNVLWICNGTSRGWDYLILNP